MIKTARLNIFKELRLQAWLRFFHRHDKSGETTWLHSFHFLVNTIFMCRTTGDSEIRTRDLLNVISPPWLSIVMVPKCICNSGLVVVEQTSFLHSTTLKAMRTQHIDNGEKIPLHSYHVIFPQKKRNWMEKIVVLISPLELLFTPFVIFYTHHDDVYCLPLQRKRVI